MTGIADYKIIHERLGQGSFGAVQVARHLPTQKQVALKVPVALDATMTMDLGDSAQFEKEAQLWQLLCMRKLAGIAELFEYGVRPYPWLAMEYLSSGTLRAR